MGKQAHPDIDRWWNRKWTLAKIGGVCSIISILSGILIVLACGPEYSDAIRPLAVAGMWGGMVPLVAFTTEAAVENIVTARRH